MSVGSAFIMAGAIVVVLALFVVIVILANRRPYFKRPKPAREPVTGGVHRGDPRSVSPRRDEYVEPPADQHG